MEKLIWKTEQRLVKDLILTDANSILENRMGSRKINDKIFENFGL